MEKLAKSASKVMPGADPNSANLITKFGYPSESGDRGGDGRWVRSLPEKILKNYVIFSSCLYFLWRAN